MNNCMFVCERECAEISAFHLIISLDSSCGWIESTADLKRFVGFAATCGVHVCMNACVDVGKLKVWSH